MDESATLVVINGSEEGRTFPIPQDRPLVIGRGADSDTKIRDPRLSRVHCELKLQNDEFLLTDRGSSAGTFVNSKPIMEPIVLSAGDTFQIGDTTLRIESGSLGDSDTIRPEKETPSLELSRMEDLVGEVFFRYRIDQLVAKGKSSVVFRAFDTRRERPVALKILKPQMTSDDQQKDRFIRAMRTMLPIKHPNIVRLRKAGRTGPYCWVAMQWVDGVSINKLINDIGVSGTLDWRIVWRVALHIGRALEEAEKQQLVHRHVTPSNILRNSKDQSFLLSDLIFARALEVTDSDKITRPGDIIGDLAYTAPEALLDPRSVDTRSDLYGLGTTLYALLTGSPPFLGLTVGDMLEKIRNDEPVPPSQKQASLDSRFEQVVLRLLNKTPDRRFASPAELIRELEKIGQYVGIDADDSTPVR